MRFVAGSSTDKNKDKKRGVGQLSGGRGEMIRHGSLVTRPHRADLAGLVAGCAARTMSADAISVFHAITHHTTH